MYQYHDAAVHPSDIIRCSPNRVRWSPITRLTNLGLRLVEGELPCIQAGRSHPPVSHSRVRCRFLGTLECTASAYLGPFPSVNSSASPRLGSGGRLEAGKRLYALPDILAEPSPTGKQFHQALCQGRTCLSAIRSPAGVFANQRGGYCGPSAPRI